MSTETQSIPTSIMLTCQQVENFMMAFLDGELGLMTSLRFRFHIMMCSDCGKYLQTYKNSVAMEKRIFENPEDEAIGHVPEEIINAILQVTAKK